MVHASTPVCRASNVRQRRYKSSRCGTRFHPSVQGVQHEACAWTENYGFIQKIVALHLQLHWQKLRALLRGAAQRVHASINSGAHWEWKCTHKKKNTKSKETKKKRQLGGEEEGHNHPGHTRTAHSAHTGEREPGGPGHRTRNTTHRASTPVTRSQVAQDTADAKQQTARAHR